MENGTLDTPVEYLYDVAHEQARYLGLIKPGEKAWQQKNWQERIDQFIKEDQTVETEDQNSVPGSVEQIPADQIITSKILQRSPNRMPQENPTIQKLNGDKIFIPSEDVVARQIEAFLLVPIASGIGDLEDSLYTLNETGKVIWEKLDGVKTLNALIDELAHDFDAPHDTIGKDVRGILTELVKLNMVVCLG